MPYIIVGVLAVLVLFVIVTYNELVKRRNMVENQKSQIDVELQRRFDLIPNLVEVVKGYAGHEAQTLEAVVEARNSYINANNTSSALQADESLTTALSRLFVLVESYPDLKANSSFLNLQSELASTEKKIAFSRQFYNDSVNKLNNKVDMFPSNIIATLFGFKKEAFFQTTEAERASVKVEL